MEPPQERPTMLSTSAVNRAVNDPSFFTAIPEFAPLQRTVQAAQAAVQAAERSGGCSNCKKRQVYFSVFTEFVRIASSLPAHSAVKLKSYMGVGALLVNMIDPVTRQTKLVQL